MVVIVGVIVLMIVTVVVAVLMIVAVVMVVLMIGREADALGPFAAAAFAHDRTPFSREGVSFIDLSR